MVMEVRMARRCARCGRTGELARRLWNGPNGYRQYGVCMSCARAIVEEERPKVKAPLCPIHRRPMVYETFTQGEKLLGRWWVCAVKDCGECADEDEILA